MNLVLSRQWRMNAPLAPDGLAIGIVPKIALTAFAGNSIVQALKGGGKQHIVMIALAVVIWLGMGLISRVAPQLNVFVFSQPLKSLLAHLMMLLFVFFVYESLQEFLRPENGVLDFLRATL